MVKRRPIRDSPKSGRNLERRKPKTGQEFRDEYKRGFLTKSFGFGKQSARPMSRRTTSVDFQELPSDIFTVNREINGSCRIGCQEPADISISINNRTHYYATSCGKTLIITNKALQALGGGNLTYWNEANYGNYSGLYQPILELETLTVPDVTDNELLSSIATLSSSITITMTFKGKRELTFDVIYAVVNSYEKITNSIIKTAWGNRRAAVASKIRFTIGGHIHDYTGQSILIPNYYAQPTAIRWVRNSGITYDLMNTLVSSDEGVDDVK